MKHQEGSFAMQHQSQSPAKGYETATAYVIPTERVIGSDEIERHIAEGKRLQAEAIAAFFAGCARRIGAVFHRPQSASGQSGGAVAHQA